MIIFDYWSEQSFFLVQKLDFCHFVYKSIRAQDVLAYFCSAVRAKFAKDVSSVHYIDFFKGNVYRITTKFSLHSSSQKWQR